MITNVYFCITLNKHSFSGELSTKTGWQKDTLWLQLRRFRAVAMAGLWRLGQGQVSAAWLGTSKFTRGFLFASQWSLVQMGVLRRSPTVEVRCHSPKQQFPCKWFGLAHSCFLNLQQYQVWVVSSKAVPEQLWSTCAAMWTFCLDIAVLHTVCLINTMFGLFLPVL